MKLSLSLRCALTLAISFSAALVSQTAYAETLRLDFGVYSHSKPSSIVRAYNPVLNELETRMSAKLGRDVDIRIQITNEFYQSLSDLKTNRVDFSRLYPSAYIEAKKRDEGIKILALESEQGSHAFNRIFATNSDNKTNSAEPVRNHSFALSQAWVARANMDTTVFEALRLSLLEVETEDTLKKLRIDGFLTGNDSDYAAIRQAMEFTYNSFEKPLATATILATRSNRSTDEKSIEAASSILAQQAATLGTPTLGAALPSNNAVLSAAQQVNADRAANAMAIRSAIISRNSTTIESTSNVTLESSSDTTEGDDNLIINIALPKHLINSKNSQGSSKNITINLSFPEAVNSATIER